MRKVLFVLFCVLCAQGAFANPLEVSGRVVLDGKGIAGVKVTDGHDIVLTDKKGNYSLWAHDDARFVYISIPDGCSVPTRNGAPLFYKELERGPKGQHPAAAKADFCLGSTGLDAARHRFFVWADVQVYEPHEVQDYCLEAAADAAMVWKESGVPAFGVSCGDIVGAWDSGLNVPVHQACATAGFPFFTVIGNHDVVQNCETNEKSMSVHESFFGPTYYSFDFGKVHYVVLNDVFQYGRHYMGYLTESQLEWLEKDLSYVPEGSPVVVFMHIPSYSQAARKGEWNKEEYNKIIVNRGRLYDALAPYKAQICSAHEHYAEHYQPRPGLLEHVHAPLSGVFWQSLLSWDGIPWGYYVYEVDGEDISWYYKAVGHSRESQFSAFPVGTDPMKRDCVVANVWNYDDGWKVEWLEDGVLQGPMTQYRGWDRNIENDVLARREREFKWKYVGAGPTEHLFCAKPSRPDARVEVRVTDRFGKVYSWTTPQDGQYYEKALAELEMNRENDGTFRTGEYWGGVWTRDISYSTILSLAHTDPQTVINCLRRKVDKLGRIIQDTGTGGSYPCSTDRAVWTIAAWEVYLQTGDERWLREFYPISERSLDADRQIAYNPESGLYRGESSFIDWREQSYPAWMEPGDIAQSECLGTNAVFQRTLSVMAEAAEIVAPARAGEYARQAAELKQAINDAFWMEKKGYYGQYIYGRYERALSPRSETLGEALCILWDIASPEQARSIFENMPVSQYGPTIFWPQISGISSYHNNAVWPFVTAFYALAAVHCGLPGAFDFALDSMFSAYDKAGSNMENMVADDGSLKTCLNSPRQLWSVAGMLGVYQKGLVGMSFSQDGIRFAPLVPLSKKGARCLRDFRYRDAVLDITVTGSGKKIRKCLLDGKEAEPFIPAGLSGHHEIWIDMLDEDIEGVRPAVERMFDGGVGNGDGPCAPAQYGVPVREVEFAAADLVTSNTGAKPGVREPVRCVELGGVKLSRKSGVQLKKFLDVAGDGEYFIEWEYSNGNGDISTHSSCANRSLYVDGVRVGTCVFPQRGDSWELRGLSCPLKVRLSAGKHRVELRYESVNANMSITKDEVVLHTLRLCPVKSPSIFSVSTGPGEDASRQVGISWATDTTLTGSYVLLWKKGEGLVTKVLPEQEERCEVFNGINSNDANDRGFYEDAIFTKCGTMLEGLEPDTDYQYIIEAPEGRRSSVHNFRTAGAEQWSACLISDIHSFLPLPRRLSSAMAMMDTVRRFDPSLDFVLSPGDVVVWGGSYSFWKRLFDEPEFEKTMWARVNGNHDNWTKDTQPKKLYDLPNHFFYNTSYYPRNGYENEMGVCYHFRYGNALILMLNTEDIYGKGEFKAMSDWMRKVVNDARSGSNPPDFVIVVEHYEWFLGTNGKTSMYGMWAPIFDELGVDVAIAGNNHVYLRSHPLRGGVVDEKGTLYIQTPSSDNERGRLISEDRFDNRDKIANRWSEGRHMVGAIHMAVDGTSITLTLLDRHGNILDAARKEKR